MMAKFGDKPDPHIDALLRGDVVQPMYVWCSFCGGNPVYAPGLCSVCQDDEDFANCEFCHGTSCTQECDDDA